MNDATDTVGHLMHEYYDILKGGTASFDEGRLHAILAPDLDFEGPIAGHRIGAAGFIQGVAGFAQTMRGMTMIRQVPGGDTAAALYDAEMPGGTVRFAEFFRAAGGKIQSLRLLYDANDYTTRGGR